VNKAYETHLAEGLYVERRLLYATFALEDRKEGMTAFTENAHAALPSSLKGTAPDARTVRAAFSAPSLAGSSAMSTIMSS
jgi:enoyl-CoA hydratase/carnithine racemase